MSEKWIFRAVFVKDARVDGILRHRKGEVLDPKGFYYNGPNDRWVILVGSVEEGHAMRDKVPRECVRIEVTKEGEQ